MSSEESAQPLTGACQCGAVRFEVRDTPPGLYFCHCRMCRRAVGNVFSAFVPVHKAALRWLDEEPSQFASSTVARRGFCRHCGTPVSFAYNESEWIALSIGIFDDEESVRPRGEYGLESRLSYMEPRADCVAESIAAGGLTQGMVVQQYQPGGD